MSGTLGQGTLAGGRNNSVGLLSHKCYEKPTKSSILYDIHLDGISKNSDLLSVIPYETCKVGRHVVIDSL